MRPPRPTAQPTTRPTTRRRWLAAALASVLLGACAGPFDATAPRPPGPLTLDEARWLDRLSWGVNDSTARAFKTQGRERWLRQQLTPAAEAPPLPAAAQALVEAMTISQTAPIDLARRMEAQRKAAEALPDADAKQAALQAWQQEMARLAREASSRMLLRALYTPHQLQDQLGWFWFNHFNVHAQKSNLRAMVGDYDQQLHTLALGRFRDLLGAAVLHPAMLRYLDNDQNAANRLNENLGRELLELHTLGVDGGYSQADVQALARVLTGLGVNLGDTPPRLNPAQQALVQRRGLTEFNPARHDTGPKQLLGQAVTGEGLAEIEGVLDRLARHPATARHISRKLAMFFVADTPAPALVSRMAATFLASDGRIQEVLRTLFASPEFAASLGQRFKDPMHFVLSAVRQAHDEVVIVNTGPLHNWLQRLGQPPYGRQTPDGYPLDSMAWTGPGQLTARFEVARFIGNGAVNLFRADGATTPDKAPPPLLRGVLFQEALAPGLSGPTRQALAQATAPRDWASDWLSSPEFMQR